MNKTTGAIAMLNYKNLNIVFLSGLAMVFILNFSYSFGPLPYLIIVIVYLALILIGAFNIRMNFFFTSLNASASRKKEIALTFDDGPHPVYTPKVMGILKKHQVKATFFCIGMHVALHPEIIQAAYEENHFIGNHSYTHSPFFDFYPPARMRKELQKTNDIIFQATGQTPRFFRPPYGVTNPFLKKALKKTGLVSIGWKVRSLDTVKSPQKVLKRLKKGVRPGAIILFHDSHERIIPILEDFLPWLEGNGYRATRLDEFLNIQAYEQN